MSESTSQVAFDSGPTQAGPAADLERAPPNAAARIRLWPLAVIMALQWFMMLVPAWVAPATMFHFYGGFMAPLVGAGAVALECERRRAVPGGKRRPAGTPDGDRKGPGGKPRRNRAGRAITGLARVPRAGP